MQLNVLMSYEDAVKCFNVVWGCSQIFFIPSVSSIPMHNVHKMLRNRTMSMEDYDKPKRERNNSTCGSQASFDDGMSSSPVPSSPTIRLPVNQQPLVEENWAIVERRAVGQLWMRLFCNWMKYFLEVVFRTFSWFLWLILFDRLVNLVGQFDWLVNPAGWSIRLIGQSD